MAGIAISGSTNFKSIKDLPRICLPMFTVITGENGAGKSQLLEAIAKGHVLVDGLSGASSDGIMFYKPEGLRPSGGEFELRQGQNRALNVWNEVNNLLRPHQDNLRTTDFARALPEKRMHELAALVLAGAEGAPTQAEAEFNQALAKASNQLKRSFERHVDKIQMIADVEKSSGLPIAAFDELLFLQECRLPLEKADPLTHSLVHLFSWYVRQWRQNVEQQSLQLLGVPCKFLHREEFEKSYGPPPWDVVNEILRISELEFQLDPVSFRDTQYKLVLRNNAGVPISPDDLSSGEKVLMSLALALYFSKEPRQPLKQPALLLFDEPDASLHPSMSSKLLRVLQTLFVEDRGIPVVLTTHSPSTVALSPAESVFLMHKREPRLEKVDPDRAIHHLLAGVPSVSVQATNRRQIFVESDNDVAYYEGFRIHLEPHLVAGIGLHFIAAGKQRNGGCDVVKRLVEELRTNGNATVFGVVDWDRKNQSSTYLKVLGAGSRYSIENFILDPLLLAVFLLSQNHLAPEDLGLASRTKHFEIHQQDAATLQRVADQVLQRINATRDQQLAEESAQCRYVGGKQVTVPSWYLGMKGHELEELMPKAFPQLRRYEHDAHRLKLEILSKAARDAADLIPLELLILFQDIQRG